MSLKTHLSGCGRSDYCLPLRSLRSLRSEDVETSPTPHETGQDALVFFTTGCDQLRTPTIYYAYTELRFSFEGISFGDRLCT